MLHAIISNYIQYVVKVVKMRIQVINIQVINIQVRLFLNVQYIHTPRLDTGYKYTGINIQVRLFLNVQYIHTPRLVMKYAYSVMYVHEPYTVTKLKSSLSLYLKTYFDTGGL